MKQIKSEIVEKIKVNGQMDSYERKIDSYKRQIDRYERQLKRQKNR